MVWQVSIDLQGGQQVEDLELAIPSRFVWNNASIRQSRKYIEEEFRDHEFWEMPSLTFSLIATPHLMVYDQDFDLDYLSNQVYDFASARLRRAFNLNPDYIRYRDIDTVGSTGNIPKLDYQMFDVVSYGNPFDPARMLGEERDVRQPDGSMRREWILDWVNRISRSPDVYFREGFQSPAPLFRGIGSYWIFATDDFAEQVMRSGAKGIMFLDITGPSRTLDDRTRKLR